MYFYEIETNYAQTIIPPPRSLPEYDSRDFEVEEQVFSSFTYLIDLIRIASGFLSVDRMAGKDLELGVTNTDALALSWKLHLPQEKQSVVNKNGEVDELLFRAHYVHQTLFPSPTNPTCADNWKFIVIHTSTSVTFLPSPHRGNRLAFIACSVARDHGPRRREGPIPPR